MKTTDQKRAEHAWQAIERAQNTFNDEKQQDLGRQIKKFPVRVLTAGLGHAIAFHRAKGKDDHNTNVHLHLTHIVSDWMKKVVPPPSSGPTDLLERIINGDSVFLRRATDEVMAYLVWLIRFAEAHGLKGDDTSTGTDSDGDN